MIRRPFIIAFLSALMIAGAGCSSKEEPASSASRSTETAESTSANDTESPSSFQAADDSNSPSDPMAQAFAELIEKLNQAMEAGIAAEEGANDCERAAAGIKAMQARLAEISGGGIEEEFPEAGFLELCAKLTPEQQRCLRLSQQRDTPEECQEVTNGISEELRDEMETLFGADDESDE